MITRLREIYNIQEVDTMNNKIDELIHYSKNYNQYAPFDLLSTRDNDILYIEVKSTTTDKIYFSKNEIIFAYNHLDNYLVIVVKNNEMYSIDIEDIMIELYDQFQNTNSRWTIETITFKLEF